MIVLHCGCCRSRQPWRRIGDQYIDRASHGGLNLLPSFLCRPKTSSINNFFAIDALCVEVIFRAYKQEDASRGAVKSRRTASSCCATVHILLTGPASDASYSCTKDPNLASSLFTRGLPSGLRFSLPCGRLMSRSSVDPFLIRACIRQVPIRYTESIRHLPYAAISRPKKVRGQ